MSSHSNLSDGSWHYGLAHWFECEPLEVYPEWDPACLDLDVHSSAGAAGAVKLKLMGISLCMPVSPSFGQRFIIF
jgi:hypothetical protein